MSLENLTIRDAEPLIDVRRRETKAQVRQPRAGQLDGVDVGGTVGSGTGERRETSADGARVPAGGTSRKGEAVQIGGGVGVRGSSDDPQKSISCGERSAGTCSRVQERGNSRVMACASKIKTPTEAKTFNPSLYRATKVKAKGQTGKGNSESRVRENRLHGLMRGGSYLKIGYDILSHERRKPETEVSHV